MASSFFKFKQFVVYHDLCAMKVGADGVTLGAWADTSSAKNILDVGCGSGLISFMLTQRSDARITAIDIDKQSVEQTQINIDQSPWPNRIQVLHTSLQEFTKQCQENFDLIVSNPPYFSNSLKSDDRARTLARHNDSLPLTALIRSSIALLNPNGKLALILPIQEGERAIDIANEHKLYCTKRIDLLPLPHKNPKRVLLEFQRQEATCKLGKMIIETERGVYSPEYREMVKDYYLKL